MLVETCETSDTAKGDFNGITLTADKTSTVTGIVDSYQADVWRRADVWRKTPEGKAWLETPAGKGELALEALMREAEEDKVAVLPATQVLKGEILPPGTRTRAVGIDFDFSRKAPPGKFRVIGVDTFAGEDGLEGDFDDLPAAMDHVRQEAGEMYVMHVYDDEGNHVGEGGTF